MLKLKNLAKLRPFTMMPKQAFGSHGHEVYDWRDDPKFNKELDEDPRDKGWDHGKYTFPYEGRDDWSFPVLPEGVKQSAVSVNIRPENAKSDHDFTIMRVPYWNIEPDMNHEADYESEDLDFQAEDFKTQHFRKKGPVWIYFLVGNMFFIYFGLEFFFQHYPDEDHWRISRLPPLDQPDPDDTDDTESYNDHYSRDGRIMRDTGLVCDIWFDIVDGKKIVKPFAGGNQPMADI